MTTSHKSAVAAVLAVVIVALLGVTLAGWGVPLVGHSHRWAAVVVLVLGAQAHVLGPNRRDAATHVAGGLGALVLALACVAIVTASETALTLLVVASVALLAFAIARNAAAGRHPPIAT